MVPYVRVDRIHVLHAVGAIVHVAEAESRLFVAHP